MLHKKFDQNLSTYQGGWGQSKNFYLKFYLKWYFLIIKQYDINKKFQ